MRPTSHRTAPAAALIGAAMISLAAAGAARSACATFTAGSLQVTYDPLGQNAAYALSAPFTVTASSVTVAHQPTAQSVTVQFVDPNPGVGGQHRIGNGGPLFHLYGSGPDAIVNASDPVTPSNAFTIVFPSASASTGVASLQLGLNANQDIAAGDYATTLDLRYACHYTAGDTNPTQIQTGVLPISVSAPSSVRATLAGGSAAASVDFGDFSQPTRTVNVNVRSTGPFTIAASSDNGGVMKLRATAVNGGASGSNARIPYTVTLAGRAFTLDGTAVNFTRTGIGGSALPLTITMPGVQANRAGLYYDHIVLTITPLGA